MIPTIDKEQRQFDMKPKQVLSFEISALEGQFDEDVQTLASTAKQAIGDAQAAYSKAIAAVRTSTAAKLLNEWEALQVEGRRLSDALAAQSSKATRVEVKLQKIYMDIGEKEMAVIRAEGANLPSYPTPQEITAHMNAITKATDELTKIRREMVENETSFRALQQDAEQLARELATFQKHEKKVADEYQKWTGALPGYRPAKTAQQGNDFGLGS